MWFTVFLLDHLIVPSVSWCSFREHRINMKGCFQSRWVNESHHTCIHIVTVRFLSCQLIAHIAWFTLYYNVELFCKLSFHVHVVCWDFFYLLMKKCNVCVKSCVVKYILFLCVVNYLYKEMVQIENKALLVCLMYAKAHLYSLVWRTDIYETNITNLGWVKFFVKFYWSMHTAYPFLYTKCLSTS